VDDLLIIGATREQARAHLLLALTLLVALGYEIAWDKVEGPATELEFLGFLLDTVAFTVKLVPDKLEKARASLRALRDSKTPIKARDLAAVTGRLSAMKEATQCAHLYTRNFNVQINEAVRARGWAHGTLTLSPHSRNDLQQWLTNMPTCRPIREAAPSWILTTDASEVAWGGYLLRAGSPPTPVPGFQDMRRGWRDSDLRVRSINPLEMQAGIEALAMVAHLVHGSTVLWRCDNMCVVHAVGKWKSQALDINVRLRELFRWTQKHQVSLTMEHLPGVENQHADRLSRWVDSSDWRLHPIIFAKVAKVFGRPSVDCFASALNAQTPRFWSLLAEPGSEAQDFFRQNLTHERLLWINPPFALIPRILAKIKAERAVALLTTPLWEGRPWWPTLLAMLVRPPLLLPTGRCTFLPGTTRNLRGIGPTPFTTVVAMISGREEDLQQAASVWGRRLHQPDPSLARRMERRPIGDLVKEDPEIWGGTARLVCSAITPSSWREAPF
jgi:hypothetical protein